jgi:hypothetical protein
MTDWATTYSGAFVDNVEIVASDGTALFEDDAESGDAKWDYEAPWMRSDGTMSFTHNYYLHWRNVGDNGGYDSALGDARWRFGPANSGLLMWYNNNFYSDNEIFSYLEDDYGFGPKGRMLVVDSHSYPYRDPNVAPSWLGLEHTNLRSRGLMRDAPFTLQDTVPFTMTDPEVVTTTQFAGRPAVSGFHDSLGYYPGVADEGDGTYWSTVDWEASVALPAKGSYSVAGGSAYPGYHIQYIESLAGWYGFWLAGTGGTGNPADDDVQYGWHVQLLEEAADHTWAKVRIWNSMWAVDSSLMPDRTSASMHETLQYTATLHNVGSQSSLFACVPLDTSKVKYVPGSATGGAAPLPSCPASGSAVVGDLQALNEMAADATATVGAIAWTISDLACEASAGFGFQVEVTALLGTIEGDLLVYDNQADLMWTSLTAPSVELIPPQQVYLPVVLRE